MSGITSIFLSAFLLIINNENASALRVLAIYPFPGKSHSIGAEHLLEEMTHRGHTVDVVSHFPREKPIPNYRDISLRGLAAVFANSVTYDKIRQYNFIHPREFVELAGTGVCDLLGQPVLQELMKTPKGTYDVVIVHVIISFFWLSCTEGNIQ
uniref:MacB_0 protein n=1 Tax=Fopius arisanus TaxID=64838 RepID=A0A0C9QQI9_9HYME